MSAYWIMYIIDPPSVQIRPNDPVYVGFEDSFGVPDAFIFVVLLAGFVALIKKWPTGLLFPLIGFSASIYLGFLDLTFDLNQGIFAAGANEQTIIEGTIVFLNLVGAPLIVFGLWRCRAPLLN